MPFSTRSLTAGPINIPKYSLTRETLANKFQGLSDYDLEPLKKLQWKHLLLCRLSDSPHAWSSSGPVPGELKKTNATEGASHLVPQYGEYQAWGLILITGKQMYLCEPSSRARKEVALMSSE